MEVHREQQGEGSSGGSPSLEGAAVNIQPQGGGSGTEAHSLRDRSPALPPPLPAFTLPRAAITQAIRKPQREARMQSHSRLALTWQPG